MPRQPWQIDSSLDDYVLHSLRRTFIAVSDEMSSEARRPSSNSARVGAKSPPHRERAAPTTLPLLVLELASPCYPEAKSARDSHC